MAEQTSGFVEIFDDIMRFVSTGKSPIIDSWTFMDSPVPMFFLFVVYLAFIYVIGPLFMRNRKAYDLSRATRIYNILQVISCATVVTRLFLEGFKFEGAFDCSYKGIDTETGLRLLRVWYFIAFTRVAELIETVFFILRKKESQATILHIYHHLGSIFGAWMCLKYDANHRWVVQAVINCSIHVLMYTYYLLSSYQQCRKYTEPIKPYITILQIVQLVFICFHSLFHTFSECGSKLFITQAFNTALLVVLFCNFYIQTYVKKKKKAKTN